MERSERPGLMLRSTGRCCGYAGLDPDVVEKLEDVLRQEAARRDDPDAVLRARGVPERVITRLQAMREEWDRNEREVVTMANDDGRKRDGDRDDDAGLTPQERQFKRQFPNTWERMLRERREHEGERR